MRIAFFLCVSLFLINCTSKPVELKAGKWRGLIEMQNQQLPFNMDIQKNESGYEVYLNNSSERILLDAISFVNDSVLIKLHVFDAALKAKVEDDKLTGTYIKYYDTAGSLPFTATYNEAYRFVKAQRTSLNFTGKYQVLFTSEKETYPAVAIINQNEQGVTGTFLTNTGDYRFLEGNIVDDELRLSTFDGNHAFIFTAKLNGDSITGDFFSGKTSFEKWQGVKSESAALPDAESLTYLKEGFSTLDFSFPDLNGIKINSTDERFKNKVTILQIFGSWCPNCMDETKFLAPWYDANKDRGIEILGLAYERKDDFAYASSLVTKMKKKWNVNYDFVIAGTNDKDKASATLPALNKIISFPTTIFISKNGKVKYIHTGFSGPGTGIYYEQFKERFNQIVNELLAEDIALTP